MGDVRAKTPELGGKPSVGPSAIVKKTPRRQSDALPAIERLDVVLAAASNSLRHAGVHAARENGRAG